MKRASSSTGKTRIGLVDDHPLVREQLKQLINRQPDLTVSFGCGDEAECLAALREMPVDLMIVDLSLKNAHGIDLIKNLLAQYPEMQILVLSMHDEMLYAEHALRAGARGYVTKQEASQTVMTAIRAVMAGELYVSEKIARQLIGAFIHGHGHGDKESPLQRLTDRELEVFQLIGEGHPTRAVASILKIDSKTVDSYRQRVKEKLHIATSEELRQHAQEWVQRASSR